jgi:hypothetical protein
MPPSIVDLFSLLLVVVVVVVVVSFLTVLGVRVVVVEQEEQPFKFLFVEHARHAFLKLCQPKLRLCPQARRPAVQTHTVHAVVTFFHRSGQLRTLGAVLVRVSAGKLLGLA